MEIVKVSNRLTAESFFRDLTPFVNEIESVEHQYIGGVDLPYIKKRVMKMIRADNEQGYLFLAAKVEGKYIGGMVFDISVGDSHNKNLKIAYQVQMFSWGGSNNRMFIRLLKDAEEQLSLAGVDVLHLSFPQRASNSERFDSLMGRMDYENQTKTYTKKIK